MLLSYIVKYQTSKIKTLSEILIFKYNDTNPTEMSSCCMEITNQINKMLSIVLY